MLDLSAVSDDELIAELARRKIALRVIITSADGGEIWPTPEWSRWRWAGQIKGATMSDRPEEIQCRRCPDVVETRLAFGLDESKS
jgi:hypothetical protein